MKLTCHACGGERTKGRYLCRGCWWLLPEPTRRILMIRDVLAPRRVQKLYALLDEGTPVTNIRLSA